MFVFLKGTTAPTGFLGRRDVRGGGGGGEEEEEGTGRSPSSPDSLFFAFFIAQRVACPACRLLRNSGRNDRKTTVELQQVGLLGAAGTLRLRRQNTRSGRWEVGAGIRCLELPGQRLEQGSRFKQRWSRDGGGGWSLTWRSVCVCVCV